MRYRTFYLVTIKYQIRIICNSFTWCSHDGNCKFSIICRNIFLWYINTNIGLFSVEISQFKWIISFFSVSMRHIKHIGGNIDVFKVIKSHWNLFFVYFTYFHSLSSFACLLLSHCFISFLLSHAQVFGQCSFTCSTFSITILNESCFIHSVITAKY